MGGLDVCRTHRPRARYHIIEMTTSAGALSTPKQPCHSSTMQRWSGRKSAWCSPSFCHACFTTTDSASCNWAATSRSDDNRHMRSHYYASLCCRTTYYYRTESTAPIANIRSVMEAFLFRSYIYQVALSISRSLNHIYGTLASFLLVENYCTAKLVRPLDASVPY